MKNSQQNLKSCNDSILPALPAKQANNSPLPNYVIPIETPDHEIRRGIRGLLPLLGRKKMALNLLYELLTYRNPKNGAKVFPSKYTLAKNTGCCKVTAKRHMKLFEDMGILYIEDFVVTDSHGRVRYTSCRFHFTKLLFDLDNEELKGEIKSKPVRKSKSAAKRYQDKVVAFIEPSHLNFKDKMRGGGVTDDPITLQDKSCTKQNWNRYPDTTKQNPAEVEDVVVLEDQVKSIEGKKILSAYNKKFPVAGQRAREEFVDEYVKGDYDMAKLIGFIDDLHSCILLKATTFSPKRLFSMEERILPMRNVLLKRLRKTLKEAYDPKMTMDRLMGDEELFRWFFNGRNLDKVAGLMEKALISIASQVYL